MTSGPLKPQNIINDIFTGYKKVIKVNQIPDEAYEDLQETMRAEVLFKINEILDNYNIEPRKSK